MARVLEQAQICNSSGSSSRALFYHKVAPALELLDTNALAPAPAVAPSVKIYVQACLCILNLQVFKFLLI